MSSMINRAKAKQLALDYAKNSGKVRPDGQPIFTRVSKTFLDRMEAQTVAMIRAAIDSHGAHGSTIK